MVKELTALSTFCDYKWTGAISFSNKAIIVSYLEVFALDSTVKRLTKIIKNMQTYVVQ